MCHILAYKDCSHMKIEDEMAIVRLVMERVKLTESNEHEHEHSLISVWPRKLECRVHMSVISVIWTKSAM